MTERQFMGLKTVTYTTVHVHYSSYAHNRISDVIAALVEKAHLIQYGIKRIDITEEYSAVKKSIAP